MRILFFCCMFISQFLVAQNILTVGVGTTSSTLQAIIEEENLEIHPTKYKDINEKSLADKDIVALFNLGQTWDNQLIFNPTQAEALIEYVKNGGIMYLTARKGYSNLLVQLGIVLTGNDGGPTGRDWPLILKKITQFEEHPITKSLEEIQTDVSAKFVVDQNWKVLAKTNDGNPMLAARQLGAGQIILGSGERIYRDPHPTNNRYETDIEEASNYQYHLNLFRYLKNPSFEQKEELPLKEKEVFQIFPNPTSDQVTLSGKNILSIDIINVQGQIIRQEKFDRESQVVLDFEQMARGLYFLKIQTSQGTSIEELVRK